MRNKSIDLDKIAASLDISPSMYHYAVDRYNGISKYLESKGIKAEFYPQGSFRTGTVTRPMKNGVETDFDIDVICLLNYDKNIISAEEVKKIVGDALKENDTYRKKLQPEEDRCWTLDYAEVSGDVGLKLDVVPAVPEEPTKILRLIDLSINTEYAKKAILITDKHENSYDWLSSNPSGYGSWFDDINKKYLEIDLRQKKEKILNENKNLFDNNAKIEDVPDYYVRSSLQRVIQLLKRHRDIFFYRNGSKLKPSSVIITSLSAKIASETSPKKVDELLKYVINGLEDYCSLLKNEKPKERYDGEIPSYIKKENEKWWIPNPVDPDDNYADYWTDEHAKAFFMWISAIKRDLINPTPLNETQYINGLQTSFGKESIEKSINLTNSVSTAYTNPIEIKRPTKPWGMNIEFR